MDKKEQAHILDMFHDGSIIDIVQNNNNISLSIEMPYLAELISPEFTKFTLTFINCSTFTFRGWMEEGNEILDLKRIKDFGLSILSSGVESEFILTACEIDFGHGGTLKISCDEICVYTERNQKIECEDLSCLLRKYWKSHS